MSANTKQPDLAIPASIFLICLAAAAYVHTRYTATERVYTQHLGTVTFSPHSNTVGKLSLYADRANYWLTLQAVCVGLVLLASVAVIVQVVRGRNARILVNGTEEQTAIS